MIVIQCAADYVSEQLHAIGLLVRVDLPDLIWRDAEEVDRSLGSWADWKSNLKTRDRMEAATRKAFDLRLDRYKLTE